MYAIPVIGKKRRVYTVQSYHCLDTYDIGRGLVYTNGAFNKIGKMVHFYKKKKKVQLLTLLLYFCPANAKQTQNALVNET